MKAPIQGHDVTVLIMGANGPILVGEFESISININNDVETYQLMGSRMPIYLDGDVTVDGSLERGYIDINNDLEAVVGANELAPGANFTTPRLIVLATFNAPAKGIVGRKQLGGVVVDKLALSGSQGKAVMKSNYSFKAESIKNAA